MKVYGYCLKPTLVLEYKKKYLIEPLKKMESAYHYYYQRCSLEEAEYFKVLDAYNRGGYPVLVRADRFKPIPTTKYYEPMKMNEHYPAPVYTVLNDIEPMDTLVGVTKSQAEEYFDESERFDEMSNGDIRVFKTEFINGQLRTTEITHQLDLKVTLP